MRPSLRSRQRDAPKALRASVFQMHTQVRADSSHSVRSGMLRQRYPSHPMCDSASSLSNPDTLSAFSTACVPCLLWCKMTAITPGLRSLFQTRKEIVGQKTKHFLSLHILPFDLKKKPQKLLPVCARLLFTTNSDRGWSRVQPLRDPDPLLLSVQFFSG